MVFAAYSNNSVNQYKNKNNIKSFECDDDDDRQTCVCKWPFIVVTTIALMFFLTFLITFIVFPIIFKCSPKLQKDFIFPIGKTYVENYFEYTNFQKHGMFGIRNLYVPLQNKDHITLGVWHILPEDLMMNSTQSSFDYNNALLNSNFPVLLYFHGGIGNRITYLNSYKVLRKFFHVIAFDYRCYGDSSRGELSETGIVNDSVALYEWLRLQTKNEIYLWGYSLGCVLTTHTAAKLKKEKLIPAGVFLEAPFPTMIEQVQLLTFMPWFETTMLKPFNDHGFNYNTTEYIAQVDCPIAIIHAEDDMNVPFFLGFKLFDRLQYTRSSKQGNVTFYGLRHYFDVNTREVSAQKLTTIIRLHMNACRQYMRIYG
ncbi:hypothetical protein RN001_014866 [Aquatica leii]|uniref:AB hydrolase-1 domain-containing protein n=1 Tax=Aquatica leii TaxID=1421715 RepID=A0AAN7SBR2_9COLE|nr:hypothetical protein RN001_014866 [Aquatica leii]